MKEIFLLALISIPLFCTAQKHDSTAPIFTPGVLMINNDSLFYLMESNIYLPVYILNTDNQIIDSIYYPHNDSPRFVYPIKSRAYAPYYSTIVFDSYPIKNGKYKVFYNDSWGYINHFEGITEYLTWDQFILKIMLFDTTPDNPLHIEPTIDSKTIDLDYNIEFFAPQKVLGDWVYVNIFGDFPDVLGHGWLRWRDGNRLLLKTLYFSI